MVRHVLGGVIVALVLLAGCQSSTDPALETNKRLVRTFVEAGNTRDFETVAGLVAADFVRHCQATPDVDVRSRDDFVAFMTEDARTFPDSRVTVEQMVAEGDRVAIWATYSGTQQGGMGPFPPSGKSMELDFGAIFRIEEGQLAELWVTWDNLAGLAQLGHFPAPDEAP